MFEFSLHHPAVAAFDDSAKLNGRIKMIVIDEPCSGSEGRF